MVCHHLSVYKLLKKSLIVSNVKKFVHLEWSELPSTRHEIPFWFWRKEDSPSGFSAPLYSTDVEPSIRKVFLNGRNLVKSVASVFYHCLFCFTDVNCDSACLVFYPFLFTLPIERVLPKLALICWFIWWTGAGKLTSQSMFWIPS